LKVKTEWSAYYETEVSPLHSRSYLDRNSDVHNPLKLEWSAFKVHYREH